ncbi:hypothetical protein [Streptomyces sp. NPDC092129]|uniref:hypothetical protein n=1 Tax=Streptomyces sp. NPDC092129 TaxID=3366010 RepID=UPI00381B3019
MSRRALGGDVAEDLFDAHASVVSGLGDGHVDGGLPGDLAYSLAGIRPLGRGW